MNTVLPARPASATAPSLLVLVRRARGFLIFAAALALCFAKPMIELFQFAWNDELYSHIPLIPAVSLYLLWLKRSDFTAEKGRPSPLAILPLALAVALLAWGWASSPVTPEDRYAAIGYGFVALLHAGALGLLGAGLYRQVAFPLWFLVFAVPMPTPVTNQITTLLQYGSADMAQVFLQLSGMPLARSGTVFRLPGFSMEVAPQCSGIHSTLALFITSILAGYVLLQAHSRRWLLALAVVPLALLRNALRIFTIGELCVLVDPEIVHSFIHKRGGPVFFLFSLIPFLLLLVFLKRTELRRPNPVEAPITPAP